MAGSLAAISSVWAYRLGSASPRMSMGLAWLQAAGRKALEAEVDASDSLASSP